MTLNSSFLQIAATIGMIFIALSAIFIRMKAANRPITKRKIIIPPLGMSTGFMMFIVPQTHIPILWAIGAFLIGWFIFSYPLIRSTKFEKRNGEVFVTSSKSFMFILLGLLVVRLLLHEFIQNYITVVQTGALFFILAFGMLLHWRLYMLRHYNETFGAEESTTRS
ncbi:cytochrome c biogenesis protein CcdC [Paenibacillus sp. Marseille-Q4541]|uniref:CcdC family protein n=1 Tax=Paenibacillus sp. Marseille-Q4541 TaxID=2831522 RepID=UPI0032D596E9